MEIILKGVDPAKFNFIASILAEVLQLAGAFTLCSLLHLMVSIYMRNGNKLPIKALGPLPDGLIAAWHYARATNWAWPSALALFLFMSDYSTAIAFAGLDFVDIDAQGEEAPVLNLTKQNPYIPYEAMGDPVLPYTSSKLELFLETPGVPSQLQEQDMLDLAREDQMVSSFLGAADAIARGESVFLEQNYAIMNSPTLLSGQQDKRGYGDHIDITVLYDNEMYLTAVNLTIPLDCSNNEMISMKEERGQAGGLKMTSKVPNCTFTSSRPSGIYANHDFPLQRAEITAYARASASHNTKLYFQGQSHLPIKHGSTFVFPHNGLPLAWERNDFRNGRRVFGFGGILMGDQEIPFGMTVVSPGHILANSPWEGGVAREYTLIAEVKGGRQNCPRDPSGSEDSVCMVMATLTCERFGSEIGNGKLQYESASLFDHECTFNGEIEIIWGTSYQINAPLLATVAGIRARNIGWALSRRQQTMLSIHSIPAALFVMGVLDVAPEIQQVRSTTINGLFIAFLSIPAFLCVIAGALYLIGLKYLIPIPESGDELIDFAQKTEGGTEHQPFKYFDAQYIDWNGERLFLVPKQGAMSPDDDVSDSQVRSAQASDAEAEELIIFTDQDNNKKINTDSVPKVGSGFFGITFDDQSEENDAGGELEHDCERQPDEHPGTPPGNQCHGHDLITGNDENTSSMSSDSYCVLLMGVTVAMVFGCMCFCVAVSLLAGAFIFSRKVGNTNTNSARSPQISTPLQIREPVNVPTGCFGGSFELGTAIWGYTYGAEEHRNDTIAKYGFVEEWCVDFVEDFSFLFAGQADHELWNFSVWNVSSGTNFGYMFAGASRFNSDLSLWDVSSGVNFRNMFCNTTAFVGNLSLWDVSAGKDFSYQFSHSTNFNSDLSSWDVANGVFFDGMFLLADHFSSDLSDWNVSQGMDFSAMFYKAQSFNADLYTWDVSSGTDFNRMFYDASSFDSNISYWDVSSGTNFLGMFYRAQSFNADLSTWDVSSGVDFSNMFLRATKFDSNLSMWDVSSGTNFEAMFYGAMSFNSDISEWDVSSGTRFFAMFRDVPNFNSELSQWDVSSGTDFRWMFWGASAFNSDLSPWNVSSGTDFERMFYQATNFDSDLSRWDVSSGSVFFGMFREAVSFTSDLELWDVSSGRSFNSMFHGASSFNSTISDWDVSLGTDFRGMFRGASSFSSDLSQWDVSSGIDFQDMFRDSMNFNSDLSLWDVSSGIDFRNMFNGATSFNADLSQWDISSGFRFWAMFQGAASFMSNLCSWYDQLGPSTSTNSIFDGSGCPHKEPSAEAVCIICSPTYSPSSAPSAAVYQITGSDLLQDQHSLVFDDFPVGPINNGDGLFLVHGIQEVSLIGDFGNQRDVLGSHDNALCSIGGMLGIVARGGAMDSPRTDGTGFSFKMCQQVTQFGFAIVDQSSVDLTVSFMNNGQVLGTNIVRSSGFPKSLQLHFETLLPADEITVLSERTGGWCLDDVVLAGYQSSVAGLDCVAPSSGPSSRPSSSPSSSPSASVSPTGI